MRVVLIPLKQGPSVKTRLATLLSAQERVELVRRMFLDVAAAVDGSGLAGRVVLVSADPWGISEARRRGWDALTESSQSSESESVDWAIRRLTQQGVEELLRLPADLPLAQPQDIDEVLAVPFSGPGAVLVPSRDGTGTNALLRTPPDAFASRFGPDSFRLHQSAARHAGIPVQIVRNPRLELDIDTPEDILELKALEPKLETARFLHSSRIIERILGTTAGDVAT